jgi:hypothetical protein
MHKTQVVDLLVSLRIHWVYWGGGAVFGLVQRGTTTNDRKGVYGITGIFWVTHKFPVSLDH